MECKCSVPGRIIHCNSVKAGTAQINPAAFIKAELFGAESNRSFPTKHFTAVSEGSWGWGWVFVWLLGNRKTFGFCLCIKCVFKYGHEICVNKMGQQKQPHLSAFQLQWEHASPAFANQAEQLDTQQQVEQNWICAAPGTRSLAAPAARPTSGCCQLCAALKNCLLFLCFRPHRQTLCHWTSISEPLMGSANQ